MDNNMEFNAKGFTLLELIIVLALIIITLTIGVPSLQAVMIQSRVDNQVYNISKDILTARNHAIHYETQVVLCHLNASNSCDEEWNHGYSIFLDYNRDEAFQAGQDKMILVRDNTAIEDILLFSGSESLRYDSDGHLNGLSGTFRYCPDMAEDEDYARAVIVSLGGRPKLSHDLDGDGKDEIYNNSDHISCRN